MADAARRERGPVVVCAVELQHEHDAQALQDLGVEVGAEPPPPVDVCGSAASGNTGAGGVYEEDLAGDDGED